MIDTCENTGPKTIRELGDTQAHHRVCVCPPITETSQTWVIEPISEAHTAVQQPRSKQITRKNLQTATTGNSKEEPAAGWVNEGSLLQKGADNAVPISWEGEPIVLSHQHLGLFRHRNNSKP